VACSIGTGAQPPSTPLSRRGAAALSYGARIRRRSTALAERASAAAGTDRFRLRCSLATVLASGGAAIACASVGARSAGLG
jgi:hypothetical protein